MATPTKPLDPDQVKLLVLADEENTEKMRLPHVELTGEDWFLMEYIDGAFLCATLDSQPEAYLTLSLQLATSYQKLLNKYHNKYGKRAVSEDERSWVFKRLHEWGAPVLEKKLVSEKRLLDLEQEWHTLIARYGDTIYKHVHGNIHGDHVISTANHHYVLDPVDWIRPCPFDGATYDWLRAFDWTLLTAKDPEKLFTIGMKMIHHQLPDKDPQEIKTFLALRALGCLGKDILPPQESDVDKTRIKILLQLINGDYKIK